MIILMFGPNAVGKSTLAEELAGRMKRGAYVEADLLKYLIGGGLVAWSAGLHPSKHPEEYRRQLDLRNKNAVALARNFDDYGFNCVVEGLGVESEGPGTGWAEENLAGHEVRYVAVTCDPEIAMKRLLERDGKTRDIQEYIQWEKKVGHPNSGFDHMIDTSTLPIQENVIKCAAALNLELSQTASAKGVNWDIIQNK